VWAVGGYETITGEAGPIVEHWDGTAWRISRGVDVPHELESIAVVSSRDVWVAGGDVIEHWDGTRWTRVPTPGSRIGRLAVVSPDDMWGLGSQIEHYTGPFCSVAPPHVRTIALSGVGIQPNGSSEGTVDDSAGALVVVDATGRAIVRDQGGTVHLLDPAQATIVASAHVGAAGAMAVDAGHGRVFVPSTQGGNGRGSVQVLDAATGALVASLSGGVHPSAVAFDAHSGHLFVADRGADQTQAGSGITVLDAATGTTVATVPISDPTALAVVGRTGRVFVASHANSTFARIADSAVVVLDAATGRVVTTTTGIGGQIAVDEATDRVFVGHVDVTPPPTALATLGVSVLDATTGSVLRTVELGQNGDAYLVGLAVDAQHTRVFVGSFFGLTMLDAASGSVLATLDAGMPTALAVDDDTGWVYATYVNVTNQYGIPTSNGSVAIFDPATGERLTTVTVGLGPDIVAIDHTSGDALILDQSGVSILALSAGAPVVRREPEPADPAAPSPGARYFPATHHNLLDPFLTFWLRYGGVDAFGYPQTEPFVEDTHLVQYTDRALLELVDGRVVLVPLGRWLTAGRRFSRVAPFASTATRLYFARTGHSLSGGFLTYWKNHNGPVVLGAPISEVVVEGNGDGSGRRYPLQWFEKGRLEYHPEAAHTRYAFELGLLGLQALHAGVGP
jgi:hypothetical protein